MVCPELTCCSEWYHTAWPNSISACSRIFVKTRQTQAESHWHPPFGQSRSPCDSPWIVPSCVHPTGIGWHTNPSWSQSWHTAVGAVPAVGQHSQKPEVIAPPRSQGSGPGPEDCCSNWWHANAAFAPLSESRRGRESSEMIARGFELVQATESNFSWSRFTGSKVCSSWSFALTMNWSVVSSSTLRRLAWASWNSRRLRVSWYMFVSGLWEETGSRSSERSWSGGCWEAPGVAWAGLGEAAGVAWAGLSAYTFKALMALGLSVSSTLSHLILFGQLGQCLRGARTGSQKFS